MAKSKLLKSVSAALAFGTLIHGAIAQNTTPANTAGKPNAEIQAQKSETTSYSFKALENGVELSAPGKPKLFIKSSQYPSLFRITSGNLKPFLELRPGVTIGDSKSVSGTVMVHVRRETRGIHDSPKGPFFDEGWRATSLTLSHKDANLLIQDIKKAGTWVSVYGGEKTYAEVGGFFPKSGKPSLTVRIGPPMKNGSLQFCVDNIKEKATPRFGIEYSRRW